MKGMEVRMSLKITPVSATQAGKVETAMNLLYPLLIELWNSFV